MNEANKSLINKMLKHPLQFDATDFDGENVCI
jgi:hypothetical protein